MKNTLLAGLPLLSPLAILVAATQAAAQTPSLEQRVSELERLAQRNRSDAQPRDASFRATWVGVDTAGIPNLQGASSLPGVSSTVDLRLWGRSNFQTSYSNFQGMGGVGGPDFLNYVTAEGMDEVNFNPRDTRFGFAAANKIDDDLTGRAVVEVDFYGSTNDGFAPRLRLAYVEVEEDDSDDDSWSIRAGQDWLPIAQQNPGMLDFGILAFSGNLYNQVPQITGRYSKGNNEFLVSLVQHRVGNGQDQRERAPWLMARYGWNGFMDGRGTIAVGGGVRSTSTPGGNDVTPYIGVVEVNMPICGGATLNGEAWIGEGVGREFLRMDLDFNSLGQEIGGAGGFVSVQWPLCEKVSVNFGIGVDQPSDSDTTATTAYGAAVPYDSNQQIFGNIRYQVSQQVGFGFEVVDVTTNSVDTGTGSTERNGQRYTFGTWFIF